MPLLELYVLSVGQADTTIIKTPGGNIIVIDAVRTDKMRCVLKRIMKGMSGEIAHLIVTHPHDDHYDAATDLLEEFSIRHVVLPPLLPDVSYKPGYLDIINMCDDLQPETQLRFIAGHECIYPDGVGIPEKERPELHLLGPTNNLLARLQRANKLKENHYSIISRLRLGRFAMVFAADAQMENWETYDSEELLRGTCRVLRASHHGSKNGTQPERLERLSPSLVVISSQPDGKHKLPDLVGSATFLKYNKYASKRVVMTSDTGTIRIEVTRQGGIYRTYSYGEDFDVDIVPWDDETNTVPDTDWKTLLDSRSS